MARSWCSAAFSLCVALMPAGCAAPRASVNPADVWPAFQRNPDHNAVIARKNFTTEWKIDAGGHINGGLAVTGSALFVDTFAGDLLALNLSDGTVVWRSHVDNVLMSTPVIHEGIVYVGSGTSALLPKRKNQRYNIFGRPEGDAIYAFDAVTGAKRWSFRTVGEDMPSPAIVRGVLVFANGDFHAYGLDAATGRLLWKRSLPGAATMASATPADGRVLLSTCRYYLQPPYDCETEAVDPLSGKRLWSVPDGDADAAPTYAKGSVFLSGSIEVPARWNDVQRYYADVAAVDARTGKRKWHYVDTAPGFPSSVGSRERSIAGTYANGMYFQPVPGRSQIIALDASSGKLRWRFQALAPVKMSPLVFRGRVYVGGAAGVMYVLDASTGNLLRTITSRNGYTTSPPIVVGNTLLVTRDRQVVAIPLNALKEAAQ